MSTSPQSSACSSGPSSPTPSPPLSAEQRRLRLARLDAKRGLESAPLWLDWRKAVERLQRLTDAQSQSPLSAAQPSGEGQSDSPRHRRTDLQSSGHRHLQRQQRRRGALSSTDGGGDSGTSTPSSPSTASLSASPVSAASSLSTASSLLTPEALLSLSDGFELLDEADPVFVEQARVTALVTAQRCVDRIKGRLMRCDEWRALVRINEQLRAQARKETEGMRAALRGWNAAATTQTDLLESPVQRSVPATRDAKAKAAAVDITASAAAAPSAESRKDSGVGEAFTPPSSLSSSMCTSPVTAGSSSALRPARLSSPSRALLSDPLVLSAAPRAAATHPPPPAVPLMVPPSSAAIVLTAQSAQAPAAVHPSASRLVASSPSASLLLGPGAFPLFPSPGLPAFPGGSLSSSERVSAFSFVRQRVEEPTQVHVTVGLAQGSSSSSASGKAAGASSPRAATFTSTAGRHAAGDPSRLRSPSWCSGLIEDPHAVVPPLGLGLTSSDVHAFMCGSEKHQLQRLWVRRDGRSLLSALLRASVFEFDRNHEHPSAQRVEAMRRDMADKVGAWTDERFRSILPRGLRAISRANFLAHQLSPTAMDVVDPALVHVWRAVTPKAPRVYVITLAPLAQSASRPAHSAAADEQQTGSSSLAPPSLPHSLRLQVFGDAEPSSESPCVLLYQNLLVSPPHHEALAWKKGTRGPSRLKSLLAFHEPIVAALEDWQRQKQTQRALTRKRKRDSANSPAEADGSGLPPPLSATASVSPLVASAPSPLSSLSATGSLPSLEVTAGSMPSLTTPTFASLSLSTPLHAASSTTTTTVRVLIPPPTSPPCEPLSSTSSALTAPASAPQSPEDSGGLRVPKKEERRSSFLSLLVNDPLVAPSPAAHRARDDEHSGEGTDDDASQRPKRLKREDRSEDTNMAVQEPALLLSALTALGCPSRAGSTTSSSATEQTADEAPDSPSQALRKGYAALLSRLQSRRAPPLSPSGPLSMS